MDYKQHKGNLRGKIKDIVERKLYNKRIRKEEITIEEQLSCGDCENYAEYDGGIKYCSVCGTKLN